MSLTLPISWNCPNWSMGTSSLRRLEFFFTIKLLSWDAFALCKASEIRCCYYLLLKACMLKDPSEFKTLCRIMKYTMWCFGEYRLDFSSSSLMSTEESDSYELSLCSEMTEIFSIW